MLDLFTTGNLVFVLLSAGTLYFILWFRANLKVRVRQESNYTRFERFEHKLTYPTDVYKCYSNAVNGTWAPADYEALCTEITKSPSIVFRGMFPKPDYGVRYSLKLDREPKIIYVALGNDRYDWNSSHSPFASS